MEKITMAHGSGGEATRNLIEDIFKKHFYTNSYELSDSALLKGAEKLAFTTDSFVVEPIFFPGGDIGKLAICGTVNDLLTSGAIPRYISAGFIIQAGLPIEKLEKICVSMASAAKEANVKIVTGDTKVVESELAKGGLYINTSGIGIFEQEPVDRKSVCSGDSIILTGSLGDHHACIQAQRLKIRSEIKSDVAPLTDIIIALRQAKILISCMQDITRGGLSTVLCELHESYGFSAVINENDLPISNSIASFSKMLGLDVLHMGNEGNMLIILPSEFANEAIQIIRTQAYGEKAAIIGSIAEVERPCIITKLGGRKLLSPLRGEGLPRIC